ncbi:unnamed protein product, partial [marine sediment metagenome]
NGKILEVKEGVGSQRRKIFLSSQYKIKQNEEFIFKKLVTVYTTRDPDFKEKEKVSDKEIEKAAVDNLKKLIKLGYDKLFFPLIIFLSIHFEKHPLVYHYHLC